MNLENDDLDIILSKVSKSVMEISYLVRNVKDNTRHCSKITNTITINVCLYIM